MDDKIIENIKNIYPTYQSSKDITLSITRKWYIWK
jgi:hypothetical protein